MTPPDKQMRRCNALAKDFMEATHQYSDIPFYGDIAILPLGSEFVRVQDQAGSEQWVDILVGL